ncbi:beta family protein [Variovorax gossypii]
MLSTNWRQWRWPAGTDGRDRLRQLLLDSLRRWTIAAGCSSTTLAGGSFPLNLVGRKQGLHDIERVEWKVWKALISKPAYAKVLFSDYTVSNPAPAPDIDPTMMNPSVASHHLVFTSSAI